MKINMKDLEILDLYENVNKDKTTNFMKKIVDVSLKNRYPLLEKGGTPWK